MTTATTTRTRRQRKPETPEKETAASARWAEGHWLDVHSGWTLIERARAIAPEPPVVVDAGLHAESDQKHAQNVARAYDDVFGCTPEQVAAWRQAEDGTPVTVSVTAHEDPPASPVTSPRAFSADPLYEMDSNGDLRRVPPPEADEPGIYRNTREGEYTGPSSFPSQGGPHADAPGRGSQEKPPPSHEPRQDDEALDERDGTAPS